MTADKSTGGLPPALAARPRDSRRGLPIPPVNVHPDPATGEPRVDFTTINTTVSTQLAADRRCSLCSGEMKYWVAFLGGPRAVELMQFTDPPGCVACMTSAVTLCPYIVVERHRRLRGELAGAGSLPPGSHGEKPPCWVLGVTRRFRAVPLPGGFTAYLPAPFRTVHAYTYAADGRINPVPTIRHQ
jgi:hypothetical protein